MKMNRVKVLEISFIFTFLFLTTCGGKEVKWGGYAGTMEGYEYCYEEGRDREWEEDVLYMAETFLSVHPLLTDQKVRITEMDISGNESERYSNEMYDAERRQHFIKQIHSLILRIDSLSDEEILMECAKIVVTLNDLHSVVYCASEERLPVLLKPFYEGEGCIFYIEKVPEGYADILSGKLLSINGVPMNEVVERLSYYSSREYKDWFFSDPWALNAVALLRDASIMEGDKAELLVETEQGEIEYTMDTVTLDAYANIEWVGGIENSAQQMAYRYADERNYWCDMLKEDVLYIRMVSCMEQPEYTFDNFCVEIGHRLRDAETPLKVVVDFRGNLGGYRIPKLIEQLNRHPHEQVYVLMNGGTASASVVMAYALRLLVADTLLVGSPAAQNPNMLAYPLSYHMPHSGAYFRVSSDYSRMAPDFGTDTLYPDIRIDQTFEDFQNGVDTVLTYVLSDKIGGD